MNNVKTIAIAMESIHFLTVVDLVVFFSSLLIVLTSYIPEKVSCFKFTVSRTYLFVLLETSNLRLDTYFFL